MKFTGLQSSELPDTSDAVKECVNLGQWMLFKSNSYRITVEMTFFLKTGNDIFGMNERGQIMPTRITEHLSIDEVFYFSDLPRPSSLSNTVFSGYNFNL
ncbi:hypothetical protein KZD03_00040 [Escherichia coli]|uniref:hypothetical protein n=1 Tax=Escherichia TaxID=561 RepID=UPI00039173A6|nr:hypothetical protein [Escherichia coli]MEC9672721.1 hypothetical protein [Escherichia marmotae]EFA4927685.1 hypothetical protein [Escherichia coli]EFH5715677.1 hypothetical protein [Escherichia coli]EFI3971011.1 hypothetical protein [Escherichia coli]EFM4817900.1 hypothetical protein [Escherichia coli]